MTAMQKITITQPDDWHCHLRDGDYLSRTIPDCARRFRRAIIMPNLVPPVTTVVAVNDYLSRIKTHTPKDLAFEPLMTLYLTDNTSPDEIKQAISSDFIEAAKLYPAGATTNSDNGVTNIQKIYPVLKAMEEHGLVLCVHGETVSDTITIFEREKAFVDTTLKQLIFDFPKLKIVLEHISTKHAVEFVKNASDTIAATITAHHLLLNKNDLLEGGIKPHFYCLPIVKTKTDQEALIKATTSGNPKFFLGTDSAPHAKHKKESDCGCAGIYTGFNAIEIYTEVFDKQNALDKLENFASKFGPQFYSLPVNKEKITLIKKPWQVPKTLDFGNDQLVPFMAGETLEWRLQ